MSRINAEWRRELQETLPDLREKDIAGSGFAITGYTVHENLGGDAALARLRQRLRQRGPQLMLDFLFNHMGLGHPWIEEHPEFFVAGTEADLASTPQNDTRVKGKSGESIFAYGRDPYFSGWPDTLQLNYANSALQEAMIGELMISPHLVRGPNEPIDEKQLQFYDCLLEVFLRPAFRDGQWQLLECQCARREYGH